MDKTIKLYFRSGVLRLSHADIEVTIRNRYLKSAAAMETELFYHRVLAGTQHSLSWYNWLYQHCIVEDPYKTLAVCVLTF